MIGIDTNVLIRFLVEDNADQSAAVRSWILRDLLAADGLVFEATERLDALLHGGEPATDIADYLISWQAAAAGCTHTVTFDRQAAGAIPEMELLP